LNFGAHPLAMDAHSGNARGGIQMRLTQVRLSTDGLSHPFARIILLPWVKEKEFANKFANSLI